VTDALIEEQGSAVVTGKLFNDIIKSLPEAAVTLEHVQDTLTITCQDSSFTLATMDPADFPSFPQVIADRSVELPSKKIQDAVHKVAKAVSRDESRAVLTGIFLKVEDTVLQLVATDSYRLAIARLQLPEPAAAALEVIVPGSVFEEIARLSNNEDSIQIGEAENQIVFQFGTTTFISRKIEGNYPNYEQIIPQQHNLSSKMKTAEIISAVKRAAILAQSHGSVRFTIDPDGQFVTVATQSQDIGSSNERVNAEIEGDKLEIGFNHQYIIDGLAAVDTEELVFEAQAPLKPGIFKSIGEDYYFYLTMPVRLD
jgi:DNA polymerase-3 subunit beta